MLHKDEPELSIAMPVPALTDHVSHLNAVAEGSCDPVAGAQVAELRRQLAQHRGNSGLSGHVGTNQILMAPV